MLGDSGKTPDNDRLTQPCGQPFRIVRTGQAAGWRKFWVPTLSLICWY